MISTQQRPTLRIPDGNVKLEAANSELIKVKGIATFVFRLENLEFEWDAYVADITDCGIIGYDFLYHHDCEVAARRGLTIKGKQVKCELKGVPSEINKVTLTRDFTIPAYSESILHGQTSGSVEGKFAIVEPVLLIDDQNTPLVLGRSLIDTRRHDIGIPVRVMNTSDEDIKVHAGMKIGYIHEVEHVEEIDEQENTDIDHLCRSYSVCKLHSIDLKNTDSHNDSKSSVPGSNVEHWCTDLKSLYKRSSENLEPNKAKVVENLLQKHEQAFAKSPDDHGRTHLVQHTIDTGDAKPVRQPPRRPPKAFEAEEEGIIERQLKAGIITESTSPWASPLVFVKKSDGSTRVCVDYRKVNNLTTFCAYPLPRVADCLDCLHGAKVFSTLDLQAGYWQIELKPEDRPKSAFVTRYGLFEYVTMPFGLCNAPSTFERCMELIMKGLQWKTLLIYLDDLIIFSSTFDEHISRLDEVLTRLSNAGLKLKPSKCSLFQESVIFLGHLVTSEGVKPNPEKVTAVRDWPTPKNVTGVRAFLGLCSYYRRFIRGFAHIAGPLHRLLEAGQAFEWSDECQEAFEALKTKLIGQEVMAYPDNDGLFILDTDASDSGVGATLSQMQWCEQRQQMEERPIAYASRSMTKTQRRYCTTRRELLAIVTFAQKFRHYLLGRKFLVRTDHNALRWVMSFKEPTDQMARWLEILSQFDFKLEHRAGKKHTNADALSRRDCDPQQCDCYDRGLILQDLPCGGCNYCTKKHELWSDFFEVDDVVPLTTKQIRSNYSDIMLPASSGKDYTNSDTSRTIFLMVFIMLLSSSYMVMVFLLSEIFEKLWSCVKCSHYTVSTCCWQTWKSVRRNDVYLSLHGKFTLPLPISWFRILRVLRIEDKEESSNANPDLNTAGDAASWIGGYTADEIAKLQRDDPDLKKIIEWMTNSPVRPDKDVVKLRHESRYTRHLYLLWDLLVLHNNVLYKKWEMAGRKPQSFLLQVIVPRSLQDTVMYAMHNAVTSAHLGFKKTYEKVKRRFYWYQQKESVRNWIRKCIKCGARKRPHRVPKAPLHDIRVGAPMDRLDTDILGPLPTSESGMKYILLVQDQFTKWTECYAIADQTAETVAHKIVFEFISRFGPPLQLHSDQGRNYESHLFQQVCSLLDIKKVHCTPWHPQANGTVEKFNQVLLNMISMYVDKYHKNWDRYLPLLTAAYRSCDHATTGYSPNMMMLGRETYQPIELIFGEPYFGYNEEVTGDVCDYVIELRERLRDIYDLVREHLGERCNRQRKDNDISLTSNTYQEGDLVYSKNNTKTKGLSPKLQVKWIGPGVITRKLSDVVYDVRTNQKGKSKILHHDQLKPYISDDVPSWVKKLQQTLRREHAVVLNAQDQQRPTYQDIGTQVETRECATKPLVKPVVKPVVTPTVTKSKSARSTQPKSPNTGKDKMMEASTTPTRIGVRNRKQPIRYGDPVYDDDI